MATFVTINLPLALRLAGRAAAPLVVRKTAKVAGRARELAAPHGTMAEKIRPVVTTKGVPIGMVVLDHPAGLFVLKGTQPHDIMPLKPNGVLRFTTSGGDVVFTRMVHHPGYKGDDFLLKALEESRFL